MYVEPTLLIRVLLAAIGVLAWAGLFLRCALDRYSIITTRYDSELHVLSDGDVGIAGLGLLGFIMFLTGSYTAMGMGPQSSPPIIVGLDGPQLVRIAQTLGLACFTAMGLWWHASLHRFYKLTRRPNKRRTDPGYTPLKYDET